jgi:hypothetical protein
VSDRPPTPSPVREAEKAESDGENSTVTDRAYKNPAEGQRTIREEYLYWTGTLTRRSFELSVALLGANWAIFGTVDRVLSNPWSKASILLVGVNLGLNLVVALAMSEMHYHRWEEAEQEPEKWRRAWQEAAHTKSRWPFTKSIECLGRMLSWCKAVLPIASFASFLVGVLRP